MLVCVFHVVFRQILVQCEHNSDRERVRRDARAKRARRNFLLLFLRRGADRAQPFVQKIPVPLRTHGGARNRGGNQPFDRVRLAVRGDEIRVYIERGLSGGALAVGSDDTCAQPRRQKHKAFHLRDGNAGNARHAVHLRHKRDLRAVRRVQNAVHNFGKRDRGGRGRMVFRIRQARDRPVPQTRKRAETNKPRSCSSQVSA